LLESKIRHLLPSIFLGNSQHLKSATQILIPFPRFSLAGELIEPPGAAGLILFAHGSGSSRYSPRNQFVARILRERGLATLLFDLLTPEEERQDLITRALRFDIDLLTQRLVGASAWASKERPETPLGYFCASTGAAAALLAATQTDAPVKAVVSRGGRPDLARDALPQVQAATLLLVGSLDTDVIELNEEAFARLQDPKELKLVPGATHLFEEPGALEQVSDSAAAWFEKYLAAP